MSKWSECEAFSPGGIAGCRPHRHLLLSLPYISWESAEQRITTCSTDGKWDTQLHIQVCACVCECMFLPFFFLMLLSCIVFACLTTLESVHRCRKPPTLWGGEGSHKGDRVGCFRAVYQPAPSVCCCSYCSYDLLQPKPISHRAPA